MKLLSLKQIIDLIDDRVDRRDNSTCVSLMLILKFSLRKIKKKK